MITRIGAAARRQGLSLEQFQEHWRTSHGPTAGAIPHLIRYVQYHAVLRDGRLLTGYPGFDACSELDFSSADLMDDGFRLAAEKGELKADEDRFVDKSRYSWLLGESETRFGEPGSAIAVGDDPVVLVRWLRCHPSIATDTLREVLLNEWERALQVEPLTWRRVVFADHEAHQARGKPSAEAVEFLGFPDCVQALQFRDEYMPEISGVLAGVVLGIAEHLARRIQIIGDGDW